MKLLIAGMILIWAVPLFSQNKSNVWDAGKTNSVTFSTTDTSLKICLTWLKRKLLTT